MPAVLVHGVPDREQRLVVIGVHTSEFSFEADVDNVRMAAQDRGVTYPIPIDNDRAIWSGSGITTGRHPTSSMRPDTCAIITSAKATTKNQN